MVLSFSPHYTAAMKNLHLARPWWFIALASLLVLASPLPATALQLESSEEFSQATFVGGQRLVLYSGGLQLFSRQGDLQASLPMQARGLDVRLTGGRALALVLDEATQLPRLFWVDPVKGVMEPGPPLPAPSIPLNIGAACLYRDAQGLDFVLSVGREGLVEQTLVPGPSPRLFRRLAVSPKVQRCQVLDLKGELLLDSEDEGLAAFQIGGEGTPVRQSLAEWPAPEVGSDQLAAVVAASVDEQTPVARPTRQTQSASRAGHAADEVAIWIHPQDAGQSRILGTHSQHGLVVYDLQGRELQNLPLGQLQSVDLRQRVLLGGRLIDLAVATRRDDNTLVLLEMAATGRLTELGRLPTDLDEVDGLCLGRNPDGGLDAIFNDVDGRWVQMRLRMTQGRLQGEVLREFRMRSQPEACVVDDRTGRLFLGEEDVGIWVMEASSSSRTGPVAVLGVTARGKDARGALVADVEGMALYQGQSASYLVVSSQGSSSYLVLEATPPYRQRGVFRLGVNTELGIDGVTETEGLEITSASLGGEFTRGMVVVQDRFKRLPDGAQNFKLVPWSEIAELLGL